MFATKAHEHMRLLPLSIPNRHLGKGVLIPMRL
jgi:hypothetical protein